MRRRRIAALAALLITAVAGPATAQEPGPQPGTRLRLTLPCDQLAQPSGARRASCRTEGILVHTRGDTILITEAGDSARYRLATVAKLEQLRGRRAHRLAGALMGLVVGAGVTYAVLSSGGSTAVCDQSANQDALEGTECAALVAAGGLGGAVLGLGVGSLIKSERWVEVPVQRLRVRVGARTDRGVALAIRLTR